MTSEEKINLVEAFFFFFLEPRHQIKIRKEVYDWLLLVSFIELLFAELLLLGCPFTRC